jgi:hypothetical protein
MSQQQTQNLKTIFSSKRSCSLEDDGLSTRRPSKLGRKGGHPIQDVDPPTAESAAREVHPEKMLEMPLSISKLLPNNETPVRDFFELETLFSRLFWATATGNHEFAAGSGGSSWIWVLRPAGSKFVLDPAKFTLFGSSWIG